MFADGVHVAPELLGELRGVDARAAGHHPHGLPADVVGQRRQHGDGVKAKVFGFIHTLEELPNPPPRASETQEVVGGHLTGVQRMPIEVSGRLAFVKDMHDKLCGSWRIQLDP